MKRILMVNFLLLSITSVSWGQSDTERTKSPKEVVEEFWKFETTGGRLTPEGWYKSGSFFVNAGHLPDKKEIAVISSKHNCSTEQRWIRDGQAEVVNQCVDLGRIDHSLNYNSTSGFYKVNVVHRLVLTDSHWEAGSAGGKAREVTGSLTWRIENPESLLWITVDTAIRYVRDARRRTSDPTIKKNADQTLAKLAKLR